MITVTDKAASALHETLDANAKDGDAAVLRLVSSEEGLTLGLDRERSDDQVITHDERTILVIESSLSQAYDGAVVDAVDSPEGTRLVIQPPEQP
jgi:Fe-S cluster assembly iron-binding protein IscA